MTVFLNYYDGEYKAEEFGNIIIKEGVPLWEGKECKIGDEFIVPMKNIFLKGKITPITTRLGKGNNGKWYFQGLERYGTADQFYCRKV